MSDDAEDTNILLVKKKDSKKGSLWNKLTNRRIIKQHGGFDIPEGDLHAIPKYQSPIEEKDASPEETKEALSELEKEIQRLKEKNIHTSLSQPSSQQTHGQFTNERRQDHLDQDDDLF